MPSRTKVFNVRNNTPKNRSNVAKKITTALLPKVIKHGFRWLRRDKISLPYLPRKTQQIRGGFKNLGDLSDVQGIFGEFFYTDEVAQKMLDKINKSTTRKVQFLMKVRFFFCFKFL